MSFLVAALLAYLSLCVLLFLAQRSYIYFPSPGSDRPGAEVLWLDSHGQRLRILVVSRPGARALLYFGGNAEDVAGSVRAFSAAFPDRSLYLVNYRGYGGSSGRPSQRGLEADALAVFDALRRRHDEIAVMGRSLGSGVAVYLASQRPVERLVLVTAYDSLVNVARAHYRFLPVGLLLRDRYDSAGRASAVTAPVLMVIAEEDEIIPRARSEALAQSFRPGQVRSAVIRHAAHNSLDLAPEYLDTVGTFLGEK